MAKINVVKLTTAVVLQDIEVPDECFDDGVLNDYGRDVLRDIAFVSMVDQDMDVEYCMLQRSDADA